MTKNIINRQTRSDSFLMETKQLLTEFYQQDNIHRIAPGKHDTVTANGKEKLQKRHLYMPIKETYAVLKDILMQKLVLVNLQVYNHPKCY